MPRKGHGIKNKQKNMEQKKIQNSAAAIAENQFPLSLGDRWWMASGSWRLEKREIWKKDIVKDREKLKENLVGQKQKLKWKTYTKNYHPLKTGNGIQSITISFLEFYGGSFGCCGVGGKETGKTTRTVK